MAGTRGTAAALAAALFAFAVPAGRVGAAWTQPFRFRDDYRNWAHIDPAATTAAVDTAGSGTVRLPYAPAQLAFDPTGTYALVATPAGVFAFVVGGDRVLPVRAWRLAGLAATGAAWIQGGTAFAVSTARSVTAYGLSASPGGYTARAVARAAFPGALALAPGPATLPGALLAATGAGATLLRARAGALVAEPGGPAGVRGNAGVAADSSGSVAATWQAHAVQIWLWDGSAYLRAPAWSPPPPSPGAGSVVGVAFFGRGAGYWELTSDGRVAAYAYGRNGLEAVAGASFTLSGGPDPPAGIASGWSADSLGVLYPGGWLYADLRGGALAPDPARGLDGQAWPLFARDAVLQSLPIPVPHAVDRIRVEDADCPAGAVPPGCGLQAVLPAGTSVGYAISTDGCRTWTPVAPFVNDALPPGRLLCYRLFLHTADRAVTPVVDVTDLYEIAAETADGPLPALLCQGVSC